MTLRTALFQIHWFLGITAGLVLAVVGVSGAALSFEQEILQALNRDLIGPSADGRAPLAPIELVQRIEEQRPKAQITFLVLHADPRRLSWINLRTGSARETHYIDRQTGRLLGKGRGKGFFETVTRVHRWLALPGDGNGPGRQVNGFASWALIFFALSGLYLRWPRRPLDWRVWFAIDIRRSGRHFQRMLHAVVGGWMVIFYLLAATTGLYWSYGWYRDGIHLALVGSTGRPAAKQAVDSPPDLARAWQTYDRVLGVQRPDTLTVAIRNGTIEFRAKLPGARHDRATDDLIVDAASGAPLTVRRYAERSLGQDLVTGIYELHRGAWFGWPGRIALMIASLALPLFTITGLLLYIGRRRRRRVNVPTAFRPKA